MSDLLSAVGSFSAWVSVGGAAVSLVSLFFGWRRAAAANENNTISSSNAWAQALMKYVELEIGFAIEDQNGMKRLFQGGFASLDAKQAVQKHLNDVRAKSASNLHFLCALSGKGRGLIDERAKLSKIYDSFMESGDLVITDEARRVLETYNLQFECYLQEIRRFVLSLTLDRVRLVRGIVDGQESSLSRRPPP